MITRIGRPYWIAARLLFLGLAAVFVATALSNVVRGRLGRAELAQGSRAIEPSGAVSTSPLSEYLPIARRNLFAAVAEGDLLVSGTTVQGGSSSSLQLLGTGGPDDRPFAIVEDTKSRQQKLVSLGDSLDGADVVGIGWRRLTLRRSGTDEVLTVPAHLGTAAGGKPAPRVPSTAGTPSAGSNASQIRELGEGRYMVSRAEVDHQLENLSDLFTQMRAVPNMKDGRTEGFRVFAIRQGSLFQQLGLRNNDVIQRINGIELTDPTRAMGLFDELKGETRLSLDVSRGGETRSLSYEIR